ncbi:hypothetical protein [Streptomyces fuscichromogenes]|uniref:Uncharacterized protein n=1 Tax=Streptomyces fuscichromogenes TaxID=1324013 RepID=A0A917XIG0_9ACTN|nr:hypothetical protein [Streptomyces fuscichromogenes]GGN26638.1 hypothetical protein GCM10011578_061370 [Streptomyces fuscichromogenes]
MRTTVTAGPYTAPTGRFLQVDPVYSGSAHTYDVGVVMNRLIGQLRVSMLFVLVIRALDLVVDVVEHPRRGNLPGTLGGWALTTVVLCVLVAVVHCAVHGVHRRRLLLDRGPGLLKQLRTSLLITLGVTTFGLAFDLVSALSPGEFLSALGDWAGAAAVLCVCVAVAHTLVHTAARLGRPEGREVRVAGAGLVIMLAVDAVYTQPLWTRAAEDPRTPFRLACALIALIPALTGVVSWALAGRRRREPSVAWNRALLFGIVSVPLQAVLALTFLAVT